MASSSFNSAKCMKTVKNSHARVRDKVPDVSVDENSENKVDRISSLPDSMICHILSFLPTKDAAATSMLSTKWKHIFPLTPNLKLEFDDSRMRKDLFASFVDKVLHVDLRDTTHVHAIKLWCRGEYKDRLKSWISAAVRLNVQSLDFNFLIQSPRWFAKEISKCTRLTTLKLTNSPICVLESLSLPTLKLLNLELVGLFNGTTISNLLSGCPVLEELIMVDCRDADNGFEEIKDFEVVIDTPGLEELYYYDYHVAARYTVCELMLLQKARIDLKPDQDQGGEEDGISYNVNVAELVMTCLMARCLSLSARTLQAVYCSGRLLTLFPNLVHLDLDLGVVCPRIWNLVIHILHCAPNLVILGIEMGLRKYKECKKCELLLVDWVPDCVALCLRKISILAFTGTIQEFLLLEYFLKHAKYLGQMVINIDSELKREDQVSIEESLLKLPHSSKICQVVVKTSVGENGAK
ncbi:F-box/LRR-repeat protein At4g14103 isoform X2 [Sesamum indicum]|uniref:F-box/LRR-repeat protein At4g14103 isoform X2 n=1 Tax=Sesamum indicum TaxID=4182 RepID=A0A6I9TEK8_SESIN|nr:F-box/LRR-repeat protein At4g14103 isoform X2 [Sesamum indicum]